MLLGPAHYVPVRRRRSRAGADAFATPLGDVPDRRRARARRCSDLPGVAIDDAAHAPEHSLEVHLPFLQRVLGEFRAAAARRRARAEPRPWPRVLDAVWGGPETLVVVSTDLSHYLDHDTAARRDRAHRRRDRRPARSTTIAPDDACGAYPLRGLLRRRRSATTSTVELLDLRNSGDTAGPRDRVVGYGAFALLPAPTPFGRSLVR